MDKLRSKKEKGIRFIKKKITLLDGSSQEYFIDLNPKAHIAQVR